jgi:PAS domain S-box-containing protein
MAAEQPAPGPGSVPPPAPGRRGSVGTTATKKTNSADPLRADSYVLFGAFLVLTLGIAAVGYRYYAQQKTGIEFAVRNELAAIADLKVRQVVAWRQERIGDAKLIASTQLMPAARLVLAGHADPKTTEQVRAWIQTIRRFGGYANAILVDARGDICLSDGRVGDGRQHYADLMDKVLASGHTVVSDLHYDSGLKVPHMGLSIPLRSTLNSRPEGALLLGIDPKDFLYPLIQSWPTPSKTAETLLARRDGDQVIFLSELRHLKDTAMRLRLPLSDQRIPAVRAALGFEGTMDGLDYRNVPVLATVRKVPDSTWLLVSKVDADEIYAPIHQQAFWLALIVAALTVATGAGIGFVWHQMRSRFFQQKYEAELEQRRSRALLTAVIEGTPDAVYVKDTAGRYLLVNSALARMVGMAPEEVLGLDDSALFTSAVAEALISRDRAIVASGEMVTVEEELVSKNGTSATYFTAKGPLFDDNNKVAGLFGIARDITERKRSEEERARLQNQLQEAQKLESIGRLAGGVAHDFNNLLTVINGYTDLVLAGLSEGHELRAPVVEIGKAGERAAGLTQQLLAFSRKQLIEPKIVDLNEIVKDVSTMLRRLVGENIALDTFFGPSLGTILADTGQLHQVLINLAVNARDAMSKGGRLIIETANVEVTDDYIVAHPEMKPGSYVLLTVSDTGVGMDEETRRRIFEPFFTTKPKGAGTGLGMATVYGIVKQSGGWIWVYSEPGKGTTFKIYLPRIAGQAEPLKVAQPAVSLQGTETVLIVEDQPAVRKLTVEVLERYGYNVLEVEDARSALSVSERFTGPIHLMITDVVMPGMTGRDLADHLAPLRPAMKVLYISGHTADVIARQGVLDPDLAFLSKPFTPESLATKVRELLNDHGAA